MNSILREMAALLEKPVIAALLLLMIITLFILGEVLVEFFTEHRHLKVCLPVLMEEIRKPNADLQECITHSGLLKSQKANLQELISHPTFSDRAREALALRLLDEEREKWKNRLKKTELISRIGPMLGLLGTLIPLGPGIQALGNGDVAVLSGSLLTAFDTTIIGLLCAGIAMCISYVRRKWYGNYISIQETLVECVLEVVSHV